MSPTNRFATIAIAIVDAIANAHHTVVHITARPEGGLAVTANAPQYERV
ncbi:hypothetical protein [Ilumatobacter sp.]